ncbi:MAG: Bcr/CflA family drug resistance efflux transporter [Rhodospirillaceae bacterium]|nr:Bcr/CflA family drug resistance efflux transporter [Rhodospirillaceae bacterium]
MTRDGTSKGLILILGALAALGAAAIDMYLPSLPTIERDLSARTGKAALTLSSFYIGLAFGQLFYGAVSDAYGRRRVMMGGIVLYSLASLGCILASDADELIAARFIQALGAASGGVIARAIVRDMFEIGEAARAQSFINLAFSVTPLLAPLIGGYVLIWFGWRAIFVVLCVFGVGCLVALVFRVPETLTEERRTPLSLTGLLRNYRCILTHRQSIGCILTGAFAFSCMFTFFAASPFVYIEVFKVPDQHYGLLFALNVLGIMAANLINARLVVGRGALYMLRVGSIVSAAGGTILFVVTTLEIGGLVGVVAPLILVVGSLGFIGANAIAGALAPFPKLAATTASLFGFCQLLLGGMVGWLAGSLQDGTSGPMGLIIGVMSVMGLMACLLLIKQPTSESGST